MTKLYDVFVAIPTKGLDDAFTYKGSSDLRPGQLVRVKFSRRATFGIVKNHVARSNIPIAKITEIDKVLSSKPIIGQSALALARWMSRFYATPLGETLMRILPPAAVVKDLPSPLSWHTASAHQPSIHIAGPLSQRMMSYTQALRKIIGSNKQAIVLFANYRLVSYASQYFSEIFGSENVCEISDRLGVPESRMRIAWAQQGKIKIIVGSRKSIFTPTKNLNLIIIDQPTNFGYFNDQKPAYSSYQIAREMHRRFGIDLILGDNTPDLESILLAKHGRQKLQKTATANNPSIIWQEIDYQSALSLLKGQFTLVVSPFSQSFDDKTSAGIAAYDIARTIKSPHAIISSQEKNFRLPKERPFTVIATKKITDYPELIFDQTLFVGADAWLSLPSHDATFDFLNLIWQLRAQTREKLIIQSSRPVPVLESLLDQRMSKTLADFMRSRQNFNLPPYKYEVVIKTNDPEAIIKLLPKDTFPAVDDNSVTAYFDTNRWPPANIDELYQASQKILINSPR